MTYNGIDLLDCINNHEVFRTGPRIEADSTLWSEFQACFKMGLDIDEYFKKERSMRALIVGGVIASGAIDSMRQFDAAREREYEAKQNRKR